MARRTVKIDLQARNAEVFLKLCEDIAEQNTALGVSSPLADGEFVNMTTFTDVVTRARQKREEALAHYAIAEAAMAESRHLIGTAAKQTSHTPGTLFYMTGIVKKLLLTLNHANPEALSLWGFNVVVRMVKNPGRRIKV